MELVEEKNIKKKKIDFKALLKKIFRPSSLLNYYIFLLVIGFFFFVTSTVGNHFTTPFTGDYTAQQYAFYTNGYDDWWHFFKTGEFVLYDTNTFLGASNIGSNTFYYLFDPFFLPILICPRQYIPQGMVVLTIFKMATAGLIFYFYMRSLGASTRASKITGLAYAFSGWTAWYIWFNHMTEITIVFPLMLWGVERVLKTKKPWLLMFAIFLMGITNFFFLVCCTFGAFFYAIFRYFQLIKNNKAKENLKILGIGFCAFAVGLLMCCIVVIPAALVSLNAPRAQNNEYLTTLKECLKNLGDKEFRKQLWNVTTSWKDLIIRSYKIEGRKYFALIEYVFPAMTCREIPLLDYQHSYDNVGGSLFCYYPLMILLVPALIKSCKEKHYGPLVALVLFVIALITPFCYYMFHGFTDEPYGRWTLFVETSLIAYVGLYLDKFKEDKNWPLLVGAVSTQALVLIACLCAKKLAASDDGTMFVEYFSVKYAGIIACAYIGLVYALLRVFKDKKFLKYIFVICISVEAIAMGAFVIEGHGVENYEETNNGLNNNNALHKLINQISKDDPTYYRCYSSLENSSARNDGMRNGYNGLGFFHSVYNFNLSDFLNWSAINDNTAPGSWAGSYVEKRMNLDTFLGIKYYFVRKGDVPYKDKNAPNYRCNVPLNFVDITDKYPNDYFFVFENTKFIDFAFSYDSVYSFNNKEIEETTLTTNDVIVNEELYLNAAVGDYQTIGRMKEIAGDDISYYTDDIRSTDAKQITLYSASSYKTRPTNRYLKYYYDTSSIKASYRLNSDQLLSLAYMANEQVPTEDNLLKTYHDINSRAVEVSAPGTSNDKNDQYVSIIRFPTTYTNYDQDGNMFFLKNYMMWNYRINVYFVDENYRVVTYDDHNDQKTKTSSYNRKTWREYYIAPTYDENGDSNHDTPKIKDIIIVNKGCYVTPYSLYIDTVSNYENRVQKFADYPIENIKYSTNKFTFTTNFAKKRVIVTQIPYEDGWSVKAKTGDGETKKLEVFKSQGGFVSFVSESGDTYYEMEFLTPYLQLGSYLSIIGLFTFVTTFVSYTYVSNELNQTNDLFDDDYKRNKKKIARKLFLKVNIK